jgi:hypothetical protein
MVVQRVRIESCGTEGSKEDPAKLRVIFVNAGESDAFVTEWRASLYLHNPGMPFTPDTVFNFIAKRREFDFWFEPGRFEIAETTAIPISPAGLQPRSGVAAYILGYINYHGRDGIKRNAGFCRSYRGDTGQWKTEKDSEYEYSY